MKKKCACGCVVKHDYGYVYSCVNPKCRIGYVLDMDGEISEYGNVEAPKPIIPQTNNQWPKKKVK